MQYRSYIYCFVLLCSCSFSAFAQQMVGVQLMDFTALSWVDLKGQEGYQVDLGWAFYEDRMHIVGAGYKMHIFPKRIKVGETALDGFAGYGLKVRTFANYATEIRAPAGVLFRVAGAPVHIAVGLTPVLGVYPATWFGLSGLLSIRYHLS